MEPISPVKPVPGFGSLPSYPAAKSDLDGAAQTAKQLEKSLQSTAEQPDALKDAFQDFVGQTFFSELIKAMRSTQQPAAYFNGGRAEEIFQGQMDQIFSEELSDKSSEKIAEPMYELFSLKRSR